MVKAIFIWETTKFVENDWMVGKIVLQFMLSTAWELERMGHSGIKAYRLVRDLGKRLGKLEEVLLAIVEIA